MFAMFVKSIQVAPTDWLFKSTKSVMVFENGWAHELKCMPSISTRRFQSISTCLIMPAWSGYISEIFSMILRFLQKNAISVKAISR